jgi:hypothetical protein
MKSHQLEASSTFLDDGARRLLGELLSSVSHSSRGHSFLLERKTGIFGFTGALRIQK